MTSMIEAPALEIPMHLDWEANTILEPLREACSQKGIFFWSNRDGMKVCNSLNELPPYVLKLVGPYFVEFEDKPCMGWRDVRYVFADMSKVSPRAPLMMLMRNRHKEQFRQEDFNTMANALKTICLDVRAA